MNLVHKPNKNTLEKVMERKNERKVQMIVVNEREWMIVLTTINIGDYFLIFYIFKGTRKTREYVAKYQEGAMWVMHKGA